MSCFSDELFEIIFMTRQTCHLNEKVLTHERPRGQNEYNEWLSHQ